MVFADCAQHGTVDLLNLIENGQTNAALRNVNFLPKFNDNFVLPIFRNSVFFKPNQ